MVQQSGTLGQSQRLSKITYSFGQLCNMHLTACLQVIVSFQFPQTLLRPMVFSHLIRHIKDDEWPLKLWSGSVLKILNILRDDLTVADQETL